MPTVHLICGATGAGKTTYAIALAERCGGVRLSIDPWMARLFHPDMGELSFDWFMERIGRIEAQMWELAPQLLSRGVDVVLDLGFTLREHRARHAALAARHGAAVQTHFLDLPPAQRRQRVAQRNGEQDPAVYAFEVTTHMFDFMEPRFEPPDAEELRGGVHLREETEQTAESV